MSTAQISNLLVIHCIVVGAVLAGVAVLLVRAGRFDWMSTGFWVWCSALLIFWLNPAVSVSAGEYRFYASRLALTEGEPRMLVVLVAVVLGLVAFYVPYLRTRVAVSRLRIPEIPATRAVVVGCLIFFMGAMLCTFYYRTDLGGMADAVQVEGGKFVGDATGWQYSVHRFALYPIAYLLLTNRFRLLGTAMAMGFAALRMFDARDRFSLVSIGLLVIISWSDAHGRKSPSAKAILPLVLLGAFLVQKGHSDIMQTEFDVSVEGLRATYIAALAGPNNDMLSQFFLESSIYDEHGFTYGLTFAESVVFGWLPRKHFPWKDQLFDDVVFKPDAPLARLLVGPKSSILGCLYTYGALPAVVVGMFLLGVSARCVDRTVTRCQSTAVRAWGMMVLTFVWLMFGSTLEWSFQYVAVSTIPAVGLLFLSRFGSLQAASKAGCGHGTKRTAVGTIPLPPRMAQ